MMFSRFLLLSTLLIVSVIGHAELRATGDLGLVIERERGTALIINSSQKTILKRIEGLGDLSHASVVFSRDQRYACISR